MGAMSDIRIVRGAHVIVDMNIAYDVLVDDEVVGTLRANGSFSCAVAPGPHRVQVRFLPEKEASNVVEIEVAPTQTAELACSTRPGSAAFNPLLLGRAFHLKLRSVEPEGQTSSFG
jgi:hypothetical protein